LFEGDVVESSGEESTHHDGEYELGGDAAVGHVYGF